MSAGFQVTGARGRSSSDLYDARPATAWNALADHLFHSTLLDVTDVSFQRDLQSLFPELPFDTQQKWIELLRSRAFRSASSHVCSSCGSRQMRNLALMTSASTDCGTCGARKLNFDSILSDPDLHAARRVQTTELTKGLNCRTALTATFSPIAVAASSVIVIDRFSITDAARLSNIHDSGLQKLIDLAGSGAARDLHIYTVVNSQFQGRPVGIADLTNLARALTLPSSLTVKISFVKTSTAKEAMHDRWLGFTWGTTGAVSWTMGKGLGQYNGSRTAAKYSLARQSDGAVGSIIAEVAPAIIRTVTL